MKKAVIGTAAIMLILAGAVAGRYIGEYGHQGEPDVSEMLYTPEMPDGGFLEIPEDLVPLVDGTSENPYIQSVIDLVNAERISAGLNPLEKSPEVCAASDIRAREIAVSFSHTRPDGRRYRSVLEDNNISSHFSGENVAGGYRSPEEVVKGWMNSDGHRENILNPEYTHIGVGYYYDSGSGFSYWAQLFIN